MTTNPSLSSVSESSALLSEDFSASQETYDHHTMADCAGSLPTACSSSINTEGSPTSVMTASLTQSSSRNSRVSARPELARIRELEQKRLKLRHQRFSLEQRLYEFCGKHAEGAAPPTPARHVVDLPWRDSSSGIRVTYSGPVNDRDEPHGTDGILKFSDGQVYRGDVRNGHRCGTGNNSWPDGQDYTGEWGKNSRNGRGTHIWPDGRKVAGQWQEGHLNGKVYFSWPNGATYDGTCRMGKKHGRGAHTWSDGRVYCGHFENGKESGFGTLTHPDGVKYRGQFKVGVKEGYGIMLWKTRTYDGEWIQNKPHGQGRVVWSNGATYTGQFLEGKYHGLGVYVWPSGKKFVGRWQNGVKNGHGLYTWPNGKKYDGEYKNGQKDGYGRMTWPDGQTYCGGFKRNKRVGRGVQTGADGQVIHCGMWKDDVPLDEDGNAIPQVEKAKIPKGVLQMVDRSPSDSLFEDKTSTEELTTGRKTLLDDEPERDICSSKMIANLDDDDDDELSDLGSVMMKYDDLLVKAIAPTRLVV